MGCHDEGVSFTHQDMDSKLLPCAPVLAAWPASRDMHLPSRELVEDSYLHLHPSWLSPPSELCLSRPLLGLPTAATRVLLSVDWPTPNAQPPNTALPFILPRVSASSPGLPVFLNHR